VNDAAMATTATTATATPTTHPPPRTIKGVVFDMDGCLCFSAIDFKEMRRRVGAPPGTDILEHVAAMPTQQERESALAAIAEIEHAAIEGMRLAPGALELARELDARRVPRALVTRNVLRNLNHFHALHWIPGGGGPAGTAPADLAAAADDKNTTAKNHTPPFHPAITRECGLRHKPHPDALEHIAKAWGVSTTELVMIGDSAFDDVASGRRAGSVTVLIDAEGEYDHEWNSSREGKDEVPLQEEEEEELEEAVAGASSAPPRRGEAQGGKRRSRRYLVGERHPHHKVTSLHGVRDVLLGAASRYEFVGMSEKAWEQRQEEARAAAEAAHAAVAADKAASASSSWQALE
jgi:phosphoglycolate phosphatase-like HAD superfamily hydrolase